MPDRKRACKICKSDRTALHSDRGLIYVVCEKCKCYRLSMSLTLEYAEMRRAHQIDVVQQQAEAEH